MIVQTVIPSALLIYIYIYIIWHGGCKKLFHFPICRERDEAFLLSYLLVWCVEETRQIAPNGLDGGAMGCDGFVPSTPTTPILKPPTHSIMVSFSF